MRPVAVAVLLAVVLAVALGPRGARAAGPIAPDAKAALDEGLALYEARSYEQALAAFRKGYAIDPHPDFLYAMAQAKRLSGDCRAATDDYRRFLETQPPEREASLARENLAKCEAQVPSTEPVLVPQPPASAPPVVTSTAIAPPAPTVHPQPPGADAAEPERSFFTDPASMSLASVALASAVAGTVLLSLGELRAQDAADAPDVAAFDDDVAAAHDFRIAGGTLLGVGALSACLSAIVWGVTSASSPSSPPASAPATRISTRVGADGGFVAVELEL